MSHRELALKEWATEQLMTENLRVSPLCGDASFRRYYRCQKDHESYILMDAPPDSDPLNSFINTAKILHSLNLHVPTIHVYNEQEGFALLEDFGDKLLLNKTNDPQCFDLYIEAIRNIVKLQQYPQLQILEPFDAPFMFNEMLLCLEWFFKKYLRFPLKLQEEETLRQSFGSIATVVGQQPKVLIHRDFHSRNLMVLNKTQNARLGIIDFQDAMIGPYCYDLASLGKDCYVEWPQATQQKWLKQYLSLSPHAHNLANLKSDYDHCGLQRHLKVLGVFSRLYLRDNKTNYLQNLPLTLKYVTDCLESNGWYPDMHLLFKKVLLP